MSRLRVSARVPATFVTFLERTGLRLAVVRAVPVVREVVVFIGLTSAHRRRSQAASRIPGAAPRPLSVLAQSGGAFALRLCFHGGCLAGSMSGLPQVHPHTRRRAIWMLCLACLLWGGSFPIVKALGDIHRRLDPEVSGLLLNASMIWPRFALAAVMLLPLAWRQVREGVRAREWHQAGGLTAFLAGGLLLQVDGLRFTSASTSSFLTQGYVIILPIWVYSRARRWPPGLFFLAMVLVVPGVAILAGVRWDEFGLGRGEIETLLAACFFAGQILWLERPAYRDNRGLAVTLAMFVLMALVFLIVSVLAAFAQGAPGMTVFVPFRSGAWLLLTGMLTLFCTFGAFTLMNLWQRWVSSTEAGLIYTLEPVFTAILALFLPSAFSALAGIAYENEQVTWRMLVGGMLILGANVLVQLSPPAPVGSVAAAPASGRDR